MGPLGCPGEVRRQSSRGRGDAAFIIPRMRLRPHSTPLLSRPYGYEVKRPHMSTTTRRIDHAALFAILSSLADNKQAIGRRYAYWRNGAPALEAAVAAAAMTQDELGHARTLYPLLEDFNQAELDPSQVEPMTRTFHYHLAYLDHDFQGWADFVATNFLLDTALTTFFEAAQYSSYEPLRQRARKIVQEERIHEMHADGWVRRLAKAG